MADPYELVPEATGPDLPGRVVLRPDLDEVIDALAADLFMQALACTRTFGDFHLAVTGDAQSEPVLRRLMYDPPMRDFPWLKTHLWLISEGRLDPSDPASRSAIVRGWILDYCDISAGQIHAIPGDLPDAGDCYERDLQTTLEWREKGHDRLDFALLTLDADGSMLPGPAIATSPGGLVDEYADGFTMSPRLINAARCVGILATGADRADALAKLEMDTLGGIACPINPTGGELRWYLDDDANPPTHGA